MFPSFDEVLRIGVPMYMTLLISMMWRANARASGIKNLPRRLAAIGSISFVISDTVLAFDKFYTPIMYAKLIFMITYYTAQFGITMSILDPEIANKKISQKSSKKKRA